MTEDNLVPGWNKVVPPGVLAGAGRAPIGGIVYIINNSTLAMLGVLVRGRWRGRSVWRSRLERLLPPGVLAGAGRADRRTIVYIVNDCFSGCRSRIPITFRRASPLHRQLRPQRRLIWTAPGGSA